MFSTSFIDIFGKLKMIIGNFDFFITIEIYVWIQLSGTEEFFAIAINSLQTNLQ